jgi:hypothetical protein
MSNQTTKTVQVDDSGALVTPAASTFKTANALLGSGETAADVDPAGTAIAAALLAKADDNAVVKLTGDQEVAGHKTFLNVFTVDGSGDMAAQFDPFNFRYRLGDITGGETAVYIDIDALEGTATLFSALLSSVGLKALAATGLLFQNSAGTEKLKVGADTGADVQVTGDLSVTEKQATVYSLSDSRDATMSGDETLTTASATNQYLDPADADRNLDLPNASVFIISNVGDGAEIITVRDEADATIDTIDNGVTLRFQWTGSAWRVS